MDDTHEIVGTSTPETETMTTCSFKKVIKEMGNVTVFQQSTTTQNGSTSLLEIRNNSFGISGTVDARAVVLKPVVYTLKLEQLKTLLDRVEDWRNLIDNHAEVL